MRTSPSDEIEKLSEKEVAAYLKAHPDFFCRHTDLLLSLMIPHSHPKETISLVEHQLLAFRRKVQTLEADFSDTLTIARKQEQANNQIKQFILELIESEELTQLFETIDQVLRQFLSAQAINILLVTKERGQPALKNMHFYQSQSMPKDLALKLSSNQSVVSTTFKLETLHFLFDCPLEKIASATVVPIGHKANLGLIAVGYSRKLEDVEVNQGLLKFIAQVLERIVPKHFGK